MPKSPPHPLGVHSEDTEPYIIYMHVEPVHQQVPAKVLEMSTTGKHWFYLLLVLYVLNMYHLLLILIIAYAKAEKNFLMGIIYFTHNTHVTESYIDSLCTCMHSCTHCVQTDYFIPGSGHSFTETEEGNLINGKC